MWGRPKKSVIMYGRCQLEHLLSSSRCIRKLRRRFRVRMNSDFEHDSRRYKDGRIKWNGHPVV